MESGRPRVSVSVSVGVDGRTGRGFAGEPSRAGGTPAIAGAQKSGMRRGASQTVKRLTAKQGRSAAFVGICSSVCDGNLADVLSSHSGLMRPKSEENEERRMSP